MDTHDEHEALLDSLISLIVQSSTYLVSEKLGISREMALELIDQIDDDDVVDMLIDGQFDHMPSPAAAALLLSDLRAETFTERMMGAWS